MAGILDNMSSQFTEYRIFLASPGGLQKERNAFEDVITKYNKDEAIHGGARFIPVGWKDTLGGNGRPQAIINEDLRKCDYFVLMFWDRWGSNPNVDREGQFSSGTEEEYYVALESLKDSVPPMKQLVVFFKAVDPRQLSDPGPQLSKVLDFQKKLEKEFFFDVFDELDGFKDCLRSYLGRWRRDHEDGSGVKVVGPKPQPKPTKPSDASVFEIQFQLAIEHTPAKKELQDAARLVASGKRVDAEVMFAKAISRGDDPEAFNRFGHFLGTRGRHRQAQSMYERILEISELPKTEMWQSIAYSNIGASYLARGHLVKAEEMFVKSLEIDIKLNRVEGMACRYRNFGLIHVMRGELDKAEQQHLKSLEIEKKLGRLEGISDQYNNLGQIYYKRRNFEKAKEIAQLSLEINTKLCDQERIADICGNLGLIYKKLGDLKLAKKMALKSLSMNEALNRPSGKANALATLGLIYRECKDLDKAEKMHRESLKISMELELLEEIANQYANLARICKERGDTQESRTLYARARNIYADIGMSSRVDDVMLWIDELPAETL